MAMNSGAIARGAPRAIARRRLLGRWAEIALFLLPALAVYVVFVLLPIAQSVYFSLFKWNGIEPLTKFIGLANYQRALGDPVFIGAVGHCLLLAALSVFLQLPFALALALGLNARIRGRAILRTIFFAPFVISEVITGVVWQLLLQPDGMVDQALRVGGLGALVQLWVADLNIVLFTMFVVISWKYFGFHTVLYLAGLQGIPKDLEEAAAIDGASRPQTIRYITLPLLGPTIRISVFLAIIGSLQLFDLIWVTTGGGPFNASNTMATYMIDWGFRRYQLGYGSAVAVILFVLAFAVSLAYQRFVLRRDIDGAVTRIA